MTDFLLGGTAAASLVIAMFLFKFWREARDRLLMLFSLAFLVLTLNWLLVSVFHPSSETRHYFYVLRLLAFLLILGAVLDKNHRGRSP